MKKGCQELQMRMTQKCLEEFTCIKADQRALSCDQTNRPESSQTKLFCCWDESDRRYDLRQVYRQSPFWRDHAYDPTLNSTVLWSLVGQCLRSDHAETLGLRNNRAATDSSRRVGFWTIQNKLVEATVGSSWPSGLFMWSRYQLESLAVECASDSGYWFLRVKKKLCFCYVSGEVTVT